MRTKLTIAGFMFMLLAAAVLGYACRGDISNFLSSAGSWLQKVARGDTAKPRGRYDSPAAGAPAPSIARAPTTARTPSPKPAKGTRSSIRQAASPSVLEQRTTPSKSSAGEPVGNERNPAGQEVDSLAQFVSTFNQIAHARGMRRVDPLGKNIAIVFLPGIPGSMLTRGNAAGGRWTPIFGQGKVRGENLYLPTDDPDRFLEGRQLLIRTSLLYEYRAYIKNADQYGAIKRHLDRDLNGKATTLLFSFDWRLDIQVTARMLGICLTGDLTKDTILEPALRHECGRIRDKDVIIVAHSFGGLVTWQWQQNPLQGGDLPDKARVRHIALLGAPLKGSCEMFLTLLKGYEPKGASFIERVATAYLLGEELQASAYTMPGVFQVLPYDPAERDTSCLDVPRGGEATEGWEPAQILRTEWWQSSYGKDIVDAWQPWNRLGSMDRTRFMRLLDTAIETAKEYRDRLDLSDARFPGTYFYSSGHPTTGRLRLKNLPPARIQVEEDESLAVKGDGRVPSEPIRAIPFTSFTKPWRHHPLARNPRHGALPDDPEFRSWLSMQVNSIGMATAAIAAAKALLDDPQLLAESRNRRMAVPSPETLNRVLGEDPPVFEQLRGRISTPD